MAILAAGGVSRKELFPHPYVADTLLFDFSLSSNKSYEGAKWDNLAHESSNNLSMHLFEYRCPRFEKIGQLIVPLNNERRRPLALGLPVTKVNVWKKSCHQPGSKSSAV